MDLDQNGGNFEHKKYIYIIAVGLILIFLGFLSRENYSHAVKSSISVLGNIGTGIFASGIIVWFIDHKNNVNELLEINKKRKIILLGLKTSVQGFLNYSCNKYFDIQNIFYDRDINPREISVVEIFHKVKVFENEYLNDIGNDQIKSEDLKEFLFLNYENTENFDTLHDSAENIIINEQAHVINGTMSKEEIEIINIIMDSSFSSSKYLKEKDYLNAAAHIDTLYQCINDLLVNIELFSDLLDMKFHKHTIRNIH